MTVHIQKYTHGKKKWKCCMSTNQQKIFYSWFKCHPVFPFQQFWMKYDCMFFLAFPPSAQLSYRSSSSSSRKWGQIHQWMVGQWGSVVASISTNTACCVGLSPSQPWPFSYTWLADYYVPHCGNMPQQCICFGDTVICDYVYLESRLWPLTLFRVGESVCKEAVWTVSCTPPAT